MRRSACARISAEWLGWRGRALDLARRAFRGLLAVAGLRTILRAVRDERVRRLRIPAPRASGLCRLRGAPRSRALRSRCSCRCISGRSARRIEGEARLESFLRWTDNPLDKFAECGLVVLLAAHLGGGLRLLFIEFVGWRDWQSRAIAFAFTLGLAFGLLFLLNLGA